MYRAEAVKAFPAKSKPWHGRTINMIVYRDDGPVDDGVTFQWKRKTSGDANFRDIAGANKKLYELKGVGNSDAGEYKCSVTFTDNSTSETNVITVETPASLIVGADPNRFHAAQELYQGKYHQTFIRWDSLDKLIELGKKTTLDTADKFRAEMAKDKDLAHIYDLQQRYGAVRMIDSRNGYTYLLDETTKYPGGIVAEGQFKNLWPAP